MVDQARGGLLSPWLQRARISAALPHVGGRVLDFGCGNGSILAYLPPDLRQSYVGFDVDPTVIDVARKTFSEATFVSDLDALDDFRFDTILSLAVVEHVPDVAEFISTLALHLKDTGRIVLTSPAGEFDVLHKFGARVGLFSSEASAEHNEFVSRKSIKKYCQRTGLDLVAYRRFLFGANQLFVLQWSGDVSNKHDLERRSDAG